MTRNIRVGVLGHWGGNIGHEIMGLGVETLLAHALNDGHVCVRVEQHRPFDIYSRWNPMRHLGPLRHGRNGPFVQSVKAFLNRRDVSAWLWRSSWVRELHLGIACGGPLITPHLTHGDLGLMFHHMHGAFASHRIPILNLSVGSCYPWENKPRAILESENIEFLKRVFDYSSVTTVRDEFAKELCAGLGEACELVLDTGFIAGKRLKQLVAQPGGTRHIAVNYQKLGANEDWGQGVDATIWQNKVKNLIAKLKRRHQVVFLCHNETELRLAEQIDETIPRCWPKTMREYAEFLSGVIAGITNRIHAGVALAGTGSPIVGVGTDTRLGTLQAIGLPCFYVKEVTEDHLEHTLEYLIARRDEERERLMQVQQEAMNRYVEIVRASIKK